ncbi:cytochrome aa3 quinol oxidase subunit II [Alkalihalobacillus macyae]|uniref:cytochrome aa3 quinol oxidase subunit II n=1 Tax=Guptibacillus hwajinpoensis TaxID=208199 RepID=UPI00273BDE4D|nr:cytochrome aa3 quinol oxidase subunit II [Alkalihalobacillus macyae]MDP4553050.1 cytochrome aa3 quinol oxidase subunit II [Alkalihalobacillus macyae]
MSKNIKQLMTIIAGLSLFVLSGCSDLVLLDPKGPVAATQRDLIMLSIYFMMAIVVVVYAIFAFIIVKYRDRKDYDEKDYQPDMHGSVKLEIIWTIIPVIIVVALAVPNAIALYDLKGQPKSTADKEPIVIHATAVDWKWVFSYPEENIETVNYVNVPEDHPILFKVTAADSMASFWVPQIGGQIYGMPGMVNDLYLQADETGVYSGRNSNFTGDGMAHQEFDFVALEEEEYQNWVGDTQENEPKLTEETYEKLMMPETVEEMTFSSTHLSIVDHAKNPAYAMEIREKYGIKEKSDENENSTNEGHNNH